MNVLLLEPDVILAETYRLALEADGHAVAVTASAQAAVHMADGCRPDVVVLELQLPHHNGIEFLYEFRSYAEWQRIPVVIHSYVPTAELAHAATLEHELGVVRSLYKPATSLARLCAAVRSVAAAEAEPGRIPHAGTRPPDISTGRTTVL